MLASVATSIRERGYPLPKPEHGQTKTAYGQSKPEHGQTKTAHGQTKPKHGQTKTAQREQDTAFRLKPNEAYLPAAPPVPLPCVR